MMPRRVFALVATVALVALAGCSQPSGARSTVTLPEPGPTSSPLPPIAAGHEPVVRVVQLAIPAVVNIRSAIGGQGTAEGTGFIVDPSGVVVTNDHVVEAASGITVTTSDGKRFTARAIGGDAPADIAVLQIASDRTFPTLRLGSSAAAELGEEVVAIGFPLGEELGTGASVTSGIVSAKGRTITASDPAVQPGGQRHYEDLLQTDAAINPGNSGGPLLDLSGRVIGINTAGVPAGRAENIGFAIAIDRAKPIIDNAIAHPAAPSAYLGVTTRDVTSQVQAFFGLPVDHGALVTSTVPNGPADKAGIRQGDVITGLDGQDVAGSETLQSLILEHRPGDQVDVELVRSTGGSDTVTVTLGVRPTIPQ